jgi:HK97 family phage portal protein
MNFFGLTVMRTKALPTLAPVDNRSTWWPWPRVLESFSGAFQQNVEITLTDTLTYPTAWACITLIASDVAKLGVGLKEPDADDIWNAVESPAFSPVLREPNHFQTSVQFYEHWMLSKLTRGNTYVLLERDERQVVVRMYVLDPTRVRPLVAPDRSVYYGLSRDDLSGQSREDVVVPASEIIHDRWNTLYHPLVGLSPLYAAGLATLQGLRIQNTSAQLFANGANPGGVLTAPGAINQATADRLKAYWDTNFTGTNAGKVAVLGDGLKYEPMTMTAVDTDLIKQLNWSDEKICATFHVPAWMVGVGPLPSYNNVQALAQVYHSQCLQILLEAIEALLDKGHRLRPRYRSAFDLDNLLRMDSATMMATIKDGVGAGVLKPNEGRNRLNLKPVEGGDTPYLQVQNYSLAALNKRDSGDPFAPVTPPIAAVPQLEPPEERHLSPADAVMHIQDRLRKQLAA